MRFQFQSYLKLKLKSLILSESCLTGKQTSLVLVDGMEFLVALMAALQKCIVFLNPYFCFRLWIDKIHFVGHQLLINILLPSWEVLCHIFFLCSDIALVFLCMGPFLRCWGVWQNFQLCKCKHFYELFSFVICFISLHRIFRVIV